MLPGQDESSRQCSDGQPCLAGQCVPYRACVACHRVVCLQVAEKNAWAENRDRARIAEINALVSRNRKVIEEALREDEQYV